TGADRHRNGVRRSDRRGAEADSDASTRHGGRRSGCGLVSDEPRRSLCHSPGDLGKRRNDRMSQHGLKRVVVTGMSGMSPLGTEWAQVREHLRSGRNAVRIIDNWSSYDGLNTRLGCTVPEFELPAHYNRKTTRSMGRVSIMATLTSEMALRDAGLWDHPIVHSGQMGVSFGSSSGTPDAIGEFGRMITH